jgi:hypothetical protein
MENPDEVVTVNYSACIEVNIAGPTECLKDTDPGYNTWKQLGSPKCWCYVHQCQGDADGTAVFGRYVALSDLNILKDGFGKTVVELESIQNGLCGDFDHTAVFGRPVALADLNILKANFGVMGLPDCPMTNINYWEAP